MVSNAAQNGFGAANKIFGLIITPVSGLGTAMTSFTAQNLGAGEHKRIRRGTLEGLLMMLIILAVSVGAGMLLMLNNTYLHLFLSAEKVTAETIRYGNSYLYVVFSLSPLVGCIFVVRNCVQGIGKSGFVLGAGAAELVARILVCLIFPALFAGGEVSAAAPAIAFFALCAADPCAWIASDSVLAVPFIRNILREDYSYYHEERMLPKEKTGGNS